MVVVRRMHVLILQKRNINYEKSFLQRLEHFAKGMHKGLHEPNHSKN